MVDYVYYPWQSINLRTGDGFVNLVANPSPPLEQNEPILRVLDGGEYKWLFPGLSPFHEFNLRLEDGWLNIGYFGDRRWVSLTPSNLHITGSEIVSEGIMAYIESGSLVYTHNLTCLDSCQKVFSRDNIAQDFQVSLRAENPFYGHSTADSSSLFVDMELFRAYFTQYNPDEIYSLASPKRIAITVYNLDAFVNANGFASGVEAEHAFEDLLSQGYLELYALPSTASSTVEASVSGNPFWGGDPGFTANPVSIASEKFTSSTLPANGALLGSIQVSEIGPTSFIEADLTDVELSSLIGSSVTGGFFLAVRYKPPLLEGSGYSELDEAWAAALGTPLVTLNNLLLASSDAVVLLSSDVGISIEFEVAI